MRSTFASGASLAVLGALVLWGCGGSGGSSPSTPSPTPSPTPGPQTVTVSIVGSIGNQAYRPNPASAATGDSVVFRNNDSAMHHIVMNDGSADLGDVMPGATSRSLTIRSAAPLQYHCTVHPSMVGSINGAQAPEPPPCPDPYGYGC